MSGADNSLTSTIATPYASCYSSQRKIPAGPTRVNTWATGQRATMNIIPTAIPEVLIIEPKVFGESRGFFFEAFNAREFARQTGVNAKFVQDNHSHPHQRLHLCIADQPLGVAPCKQPLWVGRPDLVASMVLQPLRNQLERLVIHCRWAQCRLTCCVHFYTYSLARERQIYVGIVTDPRARPGRAIYLKNNTKRMPPRPPAIARKKRPVT